MPTYRIGSFNMRNFGANSNHDLEKIAEIIRGEQLDVFALQEILSAGEGVRRLLKYYLPNWDYCWASPRESTDSTKLGDMIKNDTRGEGYAYIWNRRRLKLAEHKRLEDTRVFEPRIINALSADVRGVDCSFFARTPYYIRLQPLRGGFELRFVDIHIYYGSNTLSDVEKRLIEYNTLVREIYPRICQQRYGNNRPAYTVAMGDYNLNLLRPDVSTQAKNHLEEVYTYSRGRESYRVITIQDRLTTLKSPSQQETEDTTDLHSIQSNPESNYANNYDHFTYSPELSQLSGVSCGAIDAVGKYCNGDFEYYRTRVSDHLPIVMEIKI